MKGGFIISLDPRLFSRNSSVLARIGARRATDYDGDDFVQLADEEGRLFTLYERVPRGAEWEFREGPFVAAAGVEIPDMKSVTACAFECRWPDLVGRVAKLIAQDADSPTWFLDGDGVLWNADAVDPRKMRL